MFCASLNKTFPSFLISNIIFPPIRVGRQISSLIIAYLLSCVLQTFYNVFSIRFRSCQTPKDRLQASRPQGAGEGSRKEAERNQDVEDHPRDRLLLILPLDPHGDQLQEPQARQLSVQGKHAENVHHEQRHRHLVHQGQFVQL